MAQFRTSADLLDSILRRAGEPTSGTSDLENDALEYLNRIHHTIIAGGNEFDMDVDEPWIWARSTSPMLLELQPAYSTGTVSLTQGSEAGTFSSGPAASLEGWHLRIDGRDAVYKIAQHTAASTAFELDGAYAESTGATLTYKAFKLDYELVPSHIVVNSRNNKVDFIKASPTILTATLTAGTYTPAQYISHVATAITTAASGPAITGSYSAITRKFTLTSDLAGPTIFTLACATGTNQAVSAHRDLGFDDENQASAATYTSQYALGGVSRLIEPIRIFGRTDKYGNVDSVDPITMQKRYPLPTVEEGFPDKFTKIEEGPDGRIVVRFNRYVKDKTRIEVEFIPVPRDIKDNSASVPKVPRKWSEVLEYGAAAYLLLDKEDNKAQSYMVLAKAKLKAMQSQNRAELQNTSHDFGAVIPREDMLGANSRRLVYGYTDGD